MCPPGLRQPPRWQPLPLPALPLPLQPRIPLCANINPQVPPMSGMKRLLCNELGCWFFVWLVGFVVFFSFLKKRAGKHLFGPRTAAQRAGMGRRWEVLCRERGDIKRRGGMPRRLPTQAGMTGETSEKGKEPGWRHTASWPRALNLAGGCECRGEGVQKGEDAPAASPGSQHPSSHSGSPDMRPRGGLQMSCAACRTFRAPLAAFP